MTFTGRIRLYLICIAVLPPAAIVVVGYLTTRSTESRLAEQRAAEAATRGRMAVLSLADQAASEVNRLAGSPEITQAVSNLRRGRATTLEDIRRKFGVDFAEIIGPSDTVLATAHRPGLVGERFDRNLQRPGDSAKSSLTVEYDASGQHFAFGSSVPLPGQFTLYGGRYLDSSVLARLSGIVGVPVRTSWPTGNQPSPLAAMIPGQLYQAGDSLNAVLFASPDGKAFVVAGFPAEQGSPLTGSLFTVTLLVTVLSVGLAIGLGMLFSARTKREIDNLVAASQRVAAGDFETPVMAYEPGEFAYLADSFSDMILRLRVLQRKLATSEKIAAWQTVGRKIAHEIKNPLTPIGIAADDLRRSYREQLPDFDKILDEQTATIRTEVNRLLTILQEFVDFARMKPPQTTDVALDGFINGLKQLYTDGAGSRFTVENKSHRKTARFDPDLIHQLMINLTKNGLESEACAKVRVTLGDDGPALVITVEDTGPGFSPERMANAFEPFSTTKKDGSGLGLVISHRIAYDHGGTLELYNAEGGGAGVRVTLPQE